jgi:Zn finger protein HypA/HybF involved in hydrogenase expression
MNLSSVYAPIISKERQDDGTLLVTGIATDDSLDIDEQICDAAWLERAMPEWFKYGNIREQHSNIAAGVATNLMQDGSRHIVTARVVDPTSVMKVESGVLKGFSIGIRNPRVATDKAAPGGRIVDGEIVEVSLVDRPANPQCMIELAKSVGGDLQQTEQLIEKEAPMKECAECGKEYAAKESDDGMCEACGGKAAESSEMSEAAKAPEPEESEESEASEAGKAAEESEMSEASSEEKAPMKEDSETEEHMSEEMRLLSGIMQALSRIEANLGKAITSTSEAAKSVQSLDERVSKVEKSASRGPVRTAVKAAAPVESEHAAKAAAYRAKAAQTTDPELARGYLLLAVEADNQPSNL